MIRQLNFKKELVGLIGCPVWENPTEIMMEAAFDYYHMNYRYVTTEVRREHLKWAVNGLKAMGYIGFNCTTPHKIAIIDLLDGLGESASVIGAVNCVVRRSDSYIGENTDGKGFMTSLATIASPERKKVVIFGAGGAAHAVSIELALNKAKTIIIVNRSQENGLKLVKRLKERTPVEAFYHSWKEDYEVADDVDIIINCTTLGLYPHIAQEPPVLMQRLKKKMIVCDVIPNPPETKFLKKAAAQGCTTLDGLGMLVNQGKIALKYWSGIDVDTMVMRKKLESLFYKASELYGPDNIG